MKKRHHIEYALAMVLDKSLKVIVVVLTVISLLTLTGCATRGYVDRRCTETRHLTRLEMLCDYAELREPLIEKVIELDDRLKRMERKSEIGRAASAKTKKQFEQNQMEDYR
jgi:hypothetical protein